MEEFFNAYSGSYAHGFSSAIILILSLVFWVFQTGMDESSKALELTGLQKVQSCLHAMITCCVIIFSFSTWKYWWMSPVALGLALVISIFSILVAKIIDQNKQIAFLSDDKS